MNKVLVAKLRPLSWRIYVQGEEEARHVQSALRKANMRTSEVEEEPGLLNPSVYSLTVSPSRECPLTEEELVAVLDSDPGVDVSLPSHENEA